MHLGNEFYKDRSAISRLPIEFKSDKAENEMAIQLFLRIFNVIM